MMTMLRKLWSDEEGATAVEYGLIVAAIAAVIVVTVGILGGQVNTAFKTVSDNMK
jgi:pilus assembly protein Flp/PilA